MGGQVRLQAEFCFCTLPSCLLAFSPPENLEERPRTNHRQPDKDKMHGVCGRRGQVACSLGPAGLNFSSPGSSGSLLTCLRPFPLTALRYICSPLKREGYKYHQHRYHYQKTSSESQIITWKIGKKKKTELAIDNALCNTPKELPGQLGTCDAPTRHS